MSTPSSTSIKPNFSLIEALEQLIIDHYPTKQYRVIIDKLKNMCLILEEANKAKICCISDVIEKLEITLPEHQASNSFIPSSEVHLLFSRLQIPYKINALLIKLLRYLAVKLNRCSDEEAPSIFYDFKRLKSCIFTFRKSSCWNTARLDEIMGLFVQKLIRLMKNLGAENWRDKIRLFNTMRIMLVEFSKFPIFGAIITKQLYEETKMYCEKVRSLKTDEEVDGYSYNVQLAFFYILHEIITGNFMDTIKSYDATLLPNLKTVLDDLIKKKISSRESYLICNILRVIGMSLSFSN